MMKTVMEGTDKLNLSLGFEHENTAHQGLLGSNLVSEGLVAMSECSAL